MIETPARFGINAYCKTEEEGREAFKRIRSYGAGSRLELWQIERDKRGNCYAVITIGAFVGTQPKLPLIRRVAVVEEGIQ